MLESGGEKTQPVPQKQRKNACMAVLLLTIVIAVGGCVGEMGFDGIIGGGHMINNAYAEESVLLVTNETAKLTASDGAGGGDLFGWSVFVSGGTAVIGALYDDDNSKTNSGSAYVFEKNSTSGNWTQKQKLTASDGAEGDRFGNTISVYSNTAVIGASYDDDKRGSAYVFEYSSGTWTQTAKLTASDGANNDNFGHYVSVYSNTAVIGAFYDDDKRGSAYVFEYSSGNWTQTETVKLTASDGEVDDWFGSAVSLYSNTAVIGADHDDDNGPDSGSAYVFEYSSGNWTQKQKLTASDGAEGDKFGYSVSLYNNTAVISAVYDDDKRGSAYVFEYSSGNWTQTAKLTASDAARGDRFGQYVSLYSNTAVIGAFSDDDNGPDSGSAYVFEYSSGTWTQTAKLTASDAARGDRFGNYVSVYNNTAVIGAFFDDDNGPDSGSAYVFTISANQAPIAHAGDDQTVNEGTEVTLNGTATDPDTDDTLTYAWSQTQGPTITLSSSTSASPMFGAPTVTSEQTLTFSLVVNDGAVNSTPDTVNITVSNVNTPPIAHAGDDQTVNEGTEVTLNGTATDPDTDDTLTYAWSQTQGPTITLSSSTSASPMFGAPTVTSEQTLTFSLVVNDGAVNSTPDIVNITVLDTDDVLLTSPGSPSGSSGSGSSSGIGTSGGGGGRGSSTWVDDIYLKSVSWDCNAGTIKIIAGPDSDYISVAVHTTQLGIHQASIAGNDIPGYRAFVSPMHKTEDYINIKVVALSGRNLVTISESINVDACVGERTYHTPDDSTTTTIKQPVPKQEDDKDRLADFVDPKKNPQYYIDRYNNEIEYREWFDENYPGITIYEAVGLPVPDPTLEPAVEQEPTAVEQEPTVDPEPETICGPGTEPVDGFCILLTPGPEENGGGCLIATAAYGTELAPQVQLLREIRDNTVLQTQSGSAFIDSFNSFYYSFSPSIADLERQNPVFREAVKMAVTPLISSLAILDYVDIDSESEMLGYGIGIVAMNIAMYVALPVSALYYVRRLVA